MAEKDSLEDLEKEIICAICGDHYKDPRVLPCCHYYCKECVYQLALRTGLNKEFSCPECRVDTLLPQGSVSNLPIAFFINRMQDLYSKLKQAQQRKEESECGICLTGLKASAYCRDCGHFICDECIKSHQRMKKIFPNHVITRLAEVDSCKMGEIQPCIQTCTEHGQSMGLYCFDCGCLICRDCTIKDHLNHDHEFLKKAAASTKENLTKQLCPLQDLKQALLKATVNIKSTASEIENHGIILSSEITRSFRELHKILNDRETELINTLTLMISKKLDCLQSQEKAIAQSMLMIGGVMDYTEHCLQHCTDIEVMQIQRELTEQIGRTVKEDYQVDLALEPTEEINIVTEMYSAKDFEVLIKTKTKVNMLSVDPSKCTVTGTGAKYAEVGKLTQLNIVTKLCNGEDTKQLSEVSCYMKPVANGPIVDCKVDRSKLGEYLVQYIPTIRGHNYLTIEVNGQEITDSPLCVCAYLPPTELNQPFTVIKDVSTPHGVAVNSDGEIIVTEWNGNILTFDKTGKKLMDKCVKKSKYKFGHLTGIDVDNSDNLYILEKVSMVYKFSKKMNLLKKAEPSGSNLSGICVYQDLVIISDKNTNSLAVYTTDLVYLKQISSLNAGSSKTGIADLTVDWSGNLYLSHCGNQHIQVITRDGELIRFFGGSGAKFQPGGISVAGEFVYVADETNHQVSVYSLEGELVASLGKWGTGKGNFYGPCGVCVHHGYVYVCDRFNNRLQMF